MCSASVVADLIGVEFHVTIFLETSPFDGLEVIPRHKRLVDFDQGCLGFILLHDFANNSDNSAGNNCISYHMFDRDCRRFRLSRVLCAA